MPTSFPTGLDTLTNPTGADQLDDIAVLHSTQHANANDAIEALEAKVGINSSAVATSHDYKLSLVTGVLKASPNNHTHVAADVVGATLFGAVDPVAAPTGKCLYVNETAGSLWWWNGAAWVNLIAG